ncbi:hypothetical protein [Alteromonas facilis]|nr:hypothetical protein [Alteromonas facilis]
MSEHQIYEFGYFYLINLLSMTNVDLARLNISSLSSEDPRLLEDDG